MTATAQIRTRLWVLFTVVSLVATIVPTSTASAAPPPSDATIAGTVWDDANGDGVADSGEGGLDGVAVALLNDRGRRASEYLRVGYHSWAGRAGSIRRGVRSGAVPRSWLCDVARKHLPGQHGSRRLSSVHG